MSSFLNPFSPSLLHSPHHYLSIPTLKTEKQTKPNSLKCYAKANTSQNNKSHKLKTHFEQEKDEEEDYNNDDDDDNDNDEEEGPFVGRGGEERDYDKDPEFADILGTCLDDPQKAQSKANTSETNKSHKLKTHFEQENEEDDDYNDESYEEGDEFSERRGEQRDCDKDPEFADILGTCLDDPQKAQSKMEDRLRKKRNKILHTKTGSATPMKVGFNKFDFSNSYIWFEFYNVPLQKDVSLICDTIRSWHIVGRLGGCNSMNMQLSQSPLEKRPNYDAIQGANVTPTTFYNIGDLEIQDNLARIWIDVGTSEPLLLDVLINALTQISSDYVGIKQVVFGGSEFDNWREDLKTEDAGYYVHKI